MAALDDAGAHASYICAFLRKGFGALDALERLDAAAGDPHDVCRPCEDEREQSAVPGGAPALPGLGPEKAAGLLAACTVEPSLLSALYWSVCAHRLLGRGPLPAETAARVRAYLVACYRGAGAYSPHPAHEPQLLATLSAVQLWLLLGEPLGASAAVGRCAADEAAAYVRSLRLADGSFGGRTGAGAEGDCRFVYSALLALLLLGGPAALRQAELDAAVGWLLRCQNFDGGFGCKPDGACESHAGHTFCCLAGLSIAGSFGRLSGRGRARLTRWLCDRQSALPGPQAGLNGRPSKAPDTCYTWWTLASAELLLRGGRHGAEAEADPPPALSDLFRLEELREFIAGCASPTGGVSNHRGKDPDPFHTFFGLAGLSILDHAASRERGAPPPWLGEMSPMVALPTDLEPQGPLAAAEG